MLMISQFFFWRTRAQLPLILEEEPSIQLLPSIHQQTLKLANTLPWKKSKSQNSVINIETYSLLSLMRCQWLARRCWHLSVSGCVKSKEHLHHSEVLAFLLLETSSKYHQLDMVHSIRMIQVLSVFPHGQSFKNLNWPRLCVRRMIFLMLRLWTRCEPN